MTTYNGQKHLFAQLDSFAAQTRMPDEIVVRDDGSTDGTVAALRKFALTAPFKVTLIAEGRRLGFADNFLTAAAACTGDYVAFSDQDDVWLPEKIETGLAALLRDDALLSMHTSVVTDEDLQPIAIGKQGIRASMVFERGELNPHENGWGHQMMFSRRLLDAVSADDRPLDPRGKRLSHDIWICVLAAALGRVTHIDQPLCLYRQHARNADGAKLVNRRSRLARLVSVPLYRYEYRQRFCDDMRRVFQKSASSAIRREDRAKLEYAGDLYAARRDGAGVRVKLYTGATFFHRLKAFMDFRRLDDHEMKNLYNVKLLANIKDLAFGVFRLGNLEKVPHND